jgi:hypothetical protein
VSQRFGVYSTPIFKHPLAAARAPKPLYNLCIAGRERLPTGFCPLEEGALKGERPSQLPWSGKYVLFLYYKCLDRGMAVYDNIVKVGCARV